MKNGAPNIKKALTVPIPRALVKKLIVPDARRRNKKYTKYHS